MAVLSFIVSTFWKGLPGFFLYCGPEMRVLVCFCNDVKKGVANQVNDDLQWYLVQTKRSRMTRACRKHLGPALLRRCKLLTSLRTGIMWLADSVPLTTCGNVDMLPVLGIFIKRSMSMNFQRFEQPYRSQDKNGF